MALDRRCPHDGAMCHHHCKSDEGCWRRKHCAPLSFPVPGYPLPGFEVDPGPCDAPKAPSCLCGPVDPDDGFRGCRCEGSCLTCHREPLSKSPGGVVLHVGLRELEIIREAMRGHYGVWQAGQHIEGLDPMVEVAAAALQVAVADLKRNVPGPCEDEDDETRMRLDALAGEYTTELQNVICEDLDDFGMRAEVEALFRKALEGRHPCE